MKNLFLLALVAFAGTSFASQVDPKHKAAVENYEFTCVGEEFIVKSTVGDRVRNVFGVGFFLRQRSQEIDCLRFLRDSYISGDAVLFKFFDQIERVEFPKRGHPTEYAHLFSQQTSFSREDQSKIKRTLEKLGTEPFDRHRLRVVTALGNVKRDSVAALNNPEYISELKELTYFVERDSLNRFSFVNQFDPVSPMDTYAFADEAMKLELFAAQIKAPELQKAARNLAEVLLSRTSRHIFIYTTESAVSKGELSTFHLLHLTGHNSEILSTQVFPDKNRSLEIVPILIKKGPAQKLKDLITYAWILAGKPLEVQDTECEFVLGAILDGDTELNQVLHSIYSNLKCGQTTKYRKNPKFTGSLKIESAFSSENGDIYELLAKANKECRSTKLIDQLAPISQDLQTTYLRDALSAKCIKTSVAWGELVQKRSGLKNLVENLKDADADFRLKIFKQILINAETLDRNVEPSFVRQTLGTNAERALLAAYRSKTSYTRDLLIGASQADSESAISLQWVDGIKVDLDPSKISAVQQSFVDSIRTAQAAEETVYPLTEALVKTQRRAQDSDRKQDDAYQISMDSFLMKRPASLLESLSMAKAHMEEYLSKNLNSYNYSATSVFDILLRGRMQCASGTDFILLHTLRSLGVSRDNQRVVAIMKPGHVLPGIANTKSGTIEGIESTVSGRGQVTIALKDKSLPKNVRVILAEDYLLSKVLSKAFKNPEDVQKQLMARAEQVLGLKQGEIDVPAPKGNGRLSSDGLNASIFSFGEPQVPPGDQGRPNMDVVSSDIEAGRLIELGQTRRRSGQTGLSRFPVAGEKKESGMVATPMPEKDFIPTEDMPPSMRREMLLRKSPLARSPLIQSLANKLLNSSYAENINFETALINLVEVFSVIPELEKTIDFENARLVNAKVEQFSADGRALDRGLSTGDQDSVWRRIPNNRDWVVKCGLTPRVARQALPFRHCLSTSHLLSAFKKSYQISNNERLLNAEFSTGEKVYLASIIFDESLRPVAIVLGQGADPAQP